jgi:hypothetical protein
MGARARLQIGLLVVAAAGSLGSTAEAAQSPSGPHCSYWSYPDFPDPTIVVCEGGGWLTVGGFLSADEGCLPLYTHQGRTYPSLETLANALDCNQDVCAYAASAVYDALLCEDPWITGAQTTYVAVDSVGESPLEMLDVFSCAPFSVFTGPLGLGPVGGPFPDGPGFEDCP